MPEEKKEKCWAITFEKDRPVIVQLPAEECRVLANSITERFKEMEKRFQKMREEIRSEIKRMLRELEEWL